MLSLSKQIQIYAIRFEKKFDHLTLSLILMDDDAICFQLRSSQIQHFMSFKSFLKKDLTSV